ncbi:unnamed protein product [Leptosia nina]|uniref:Endonuclease/exonuclease/phosphatase domain-containing protein n=1 Tax=Leptosia nina TaxID=320188 RepID=A0AAV1J6L4_9NEOP
MSCEIVKCNSCKIVINELLAFVQNKCDVMDVEGIVRLCVLSFTQTEIEVAKKLLIQSLSPSKKRVLCKKGTKAERDLRDIVAFLKVCEPESIPIFVAKDLQKLPPITFDHIDVTRVLKDLIVIQNEVKKISSTYLTKDEFYKNYNMQGSPDRTVNFKRGGHIRTTESADISAHAHRSPPACRLSHSISGSEREEAISLPLAATSAITGTGSEAPTAVSPSLCCVTRASESRQLCANITGNNDKESNVEWQTVQRKKGRKYKYIGQRGEAVIDADSKFKPAELYVLLFINRVNKCTSEKDIHDYLVNKTRAEVKVQKITSKQDKSYDAYKVSVPRLKLNIFLDGSLWPEGVTYRRFVNYGPGSQKGETWLLPHDLQYLNKIDEDFGCTGTSAVDTSAGILRGRPYGGVALLWRKNAFGSVTVLHCASVRLAAIRVITGDTSFLVFSVYMPVDCGENLPEFTECLAEINAIVESSNVASGFILGDFNAHPDAHFGKELSHFCSEQRWRCADMEFLGIASDNFTFISDANGSHRWLDHCIVTEAAYNAISSVNILYDSSWEERIRSNPTYWSSLFPEVLACTPGTKPHRHDKAGPRGKVHPRVVG